MLYREIIAVCSHINTKHINTLCGQKIELLNVEAVNNKCISQTHGFSMWSCALL